jgi:hypothetical protein
VKHEVPIRSGPLDHRGLWVVDLEYFGYRELEESGLAHVQMPNTRSRDLITTIGSISSGRTGYTSKVDSQKDQDVNPRS